MAAQVQISIDQEVYNLLQTLMVPPINDANAVIRELLVYEGRASRGVVDLEASEQHYTMAQELERSMQGVYECGGAT